MIIHGRLLPFSMCGTIDSSRQQKMKCENNREDPVPVYSSVNLPYHSSLIVRSSCIQQLRKSP